MKKMSHHNGALIMACASFFTLMNLFGPQAIVPVIAVGFNASPEQMGISLNAAVAGMAVGGPICAIFGDRFDFRLLIVGTIALLAVPTLLLGLSYSLSQFTALRVAQGIFMSASFTISIAYIAEQWGASGSAPAVMAAYVTGNIAAQILGRMTLGMVAVYWRPALVLFAVATFMGACLLWRLLPPASSTVRSRTGGGLAAIGWHLRDPALRATFAVGFFILFAFIGMFTYVNFHLANAFGLSSAMVGLLYGVFGLALFSTPMAGVIVRRFNHRAALILGASVSICGTLLTLPKSLLLCLMGLALAAAGLFFLQAVATDFTGHKAKRFKAAASGLYLCAYYTGGMVGAAVIGYTFDNWGWPTCVALLSAGCMAIGCIGARYWQTPEITTTVPNVVSVLRMDLAIPAVFAEETANEEALISQP